MVEHGATDAELDGLVALAVAARARPDRHIPYLGESSEGLRAELIEVAAWSDRIVVARGPDGGLRGWLLPDLDEDMGRVWWFGPFVGEGEGWRAVAEALYAHALERLPAGITQQEMCAGPDHTELAAFAEDHGLERRKASIALTATAPPPSAASQLGVSIRPLAAADVPAVAALHDVLFPNTHTPGEALVGAEDPGKLRLVTGEGPAGYVAAEVQPDGSGYVDFLGVQPARRREGFGRALVVAATQALFDRGVPHVHLTVGEDNVGAIALYTSIGYVAERPLVPYRRGF